MRLLLERVVQSFAAEATRVGVDLTSKAESDPVVLGDSTRLEQILGNLVANALAHTSAGGQVALSAFNHEGSVLIRVEDTGIGIEPRHVDRVFDRFYRADDARTRERGGAGLGLSICRELTESMDGTISLRSKLGEGTVVEVTLPASQRQN